MKKEVVNNNGLPVVALVGRPNVGKSSLFNALLRKKQAVIFDRPNTTRDIVSSVANEEKFPYFLVDTAGLSFDNREEFEEDIQAQTRIAIAEADVIVFVVDSTEGLLPKDQEIAQMLRKSGKPFLLVANKAEGNRDLSEFYSLGLGDPLQTSATQRLGTEVLSEKIVSTLKSKGFKKSHYTPEEQRASLVFVGRPNVGKSSFVNAYINSKRCIVSDTPGTTRDITEIPFEYEGDDFLLLDTAGVRRRAKQESQIETFGIMRTLESLHRSDCAFLLMDAEEGPTTQDARIGKELYESGVGVCLVFNKIDLLPDFEEARKRLERECRKQFAFLSYAPLLFASAKTKKNIFEVFQIAKHVKAERKKVIDQKVLEQSLMKYVMRRPPMTKGKKTHFYGIEQILQASTPTFRIRVSRPDLIHFSYRRFLTNRLREDFDFIGVRIKLEFVNYKGLKAEEITWYKD